MHHQKLVGAADSYQSHVDHVNLAWFRNVNMIKNKGRGAYQWVEIAMATEGRLQAKIKILRPDRHAATEKVQGHRTRLPFP